MKNKKIQLLIATLALSSIALTACSEPDNSNTNKGSNSESLSGALSRATINSAIDGFSIDSTPQYMSNSYYEESFDTEEYSNIEENGFKKVSISPLSTFAIDVDTGSYTAFRSAINNGYTNGLHENALRAEEFINYFEYNFKNKVNGDKFSLNYEIGDCDWNKDSKLLAMTVTAGESNVISEGRNFVFLIDTSGSMDDTDKSLMVYDSFNLLLDSMDENDIVSVVTYASSVDTLIKGEKASNREDIQLALKEAYRLTTEGGGTNGSGGIIEAYKIAKENFIEGGNNRVIIASDGDMNLGDFTSNDELVTLIEQYRDDNIFLTTLGYGHGNYSDYNMESIANHGNGNYYYIDSKIEAERVLVERIDQSTETVAKDVKIQVEFNPNFVEEYRLIGYENRQMAAEDFEDDTKDGGETGAGQQITVLYEVKLADGDSSSSNLKYQDERKLKDNEAVKNEIATLSIRYKKPEGNSSELEEIPIEFKEGTSKELDFITGVAEFVMYMRDSEYKGSTSENSIETLLKEQDDKYRKEFYGIVKEAFKEIDIDNIQEDFEKE